MPEKQKKMRAVFEWTYGRTTTHRLLPPKPANITCGFLSAAKSAASFKNPPQALKIISKARVEFVSTPWTQPCPSCSLISPEKKTPKNVQETLTMVVCNTG